MATKKPQFMLDVHLEFLDRLRELGSTNMFGASRDLAAHFGLELEQARDILKYWMSTFEQRSGIVLPTNPKTFDMEID